MASQKICVLNGEITWESVGVLADAVYEAYLGEEKCRQFFFPVLSSGGDVDAAWSLYTILKNLDASIVTLAAGRVYSAAIIVFLAGKKRYSYPESVFLFHPATIFHPSSEEQPLYKLSEEIEGEKYDRLLFRSILAKLSHAKFKKEVEELVHESRSFFVDAKKAKKLGIVTQIINKPDLITF